MADSKFKLFIRKHPVISTILLIAFVDIVLLVASFFGLGIFTHHGQSITVPDLKGLTFDEAVMKLRNMNLSIEISDSIYDTHSAPGAIIIQTPKAGAKIKDNRTIYVTIHSFTTQQVSIPAIVDLSLRQGMSTLQAAGISNINVERIPSQYPDLIYDVKMNGISLQPGTKVPVNTRITIVVGDGLQEVADSTLLNDYNESLDSTDSSFIDPETSDYDDSEY